MKQEWIDVPLLELRPDGSLEPVQGDPTSMVIVDLLERRRAAAPPVQTTPLASDYIQRLDALLRARVALVAAGIEPKFGS